MKYTNWSSDLPTVYRGIKMQLDCNSQIEICDFNSSQKTFVKGNYFKQSL